MVYVGSAFFSSHQYCKLVCSGNANHGVDRLILFVCSVVVLIEY